MIDISNATADEIRLVIGELYGMTKDVPGNRAANMRRRGMRIIKYLNKKEYGKKKEVVYTTRQHCEDGC
jgi:hypothetical protein